MLSWSRSRNWPRQTICSLLPPRQRGVTVAPAQCCSLQAARAAVRRPCARPCAIACAHLIVNSCLCAGAWCGRPSFARIALALLPCPVRSATREQRPAHAQRARAQGAAPFSGSEPAAGEAEVILRPPGQRPPHISHYRGRDAFGQERLLSKSRARLLQWQRLDGRNVGDADSCPCARRPLSRRILF